MQPARDRMNVRQHRLAITSERFLQRPVFEQFVNNGILARERLQLPVSRSLQLDPDSRQRLGHLRRTVEIDVRLSEQRQLRNAGCKLGFQRRSRQSMRAANIRQLFLPALGVDRHSRKLHRRHRQHAFELQLRNFIQAQPRQLFRQLPMQRNHNLGVHRGVAVLLIGDLARPVAGLR